MSNPIEYTVTVWADGEKHWFLNGKLHRQDGPAIEWANGTKSWYLNGEFHREDGPAIEYTSGSKLWYRNGKRHREDGPAVEWANGTKSWYLNGELFSHSQWKQEVAKLNQPSCSGKVVEIEGKKYRLMECE